jgi:hypothetical protein
MAYDRIPEASSEAPPGNATLQASSLHSEPFFDDLLLPDLGYVTDQPSSLTYRCRRLVLARSAAAINTALQETLKLTGYASIGVNNIAEFNFDNFEQRAWVDEWRGNFFRQLWALREDLEYQGYKLQQNIKIVDWVARINNQEDSGEKKLWDPQNIYADIETRYGEKSKRWKGFLQLEQNEEEDNDLAVDAELQPKKGEEFKSLLLKKVLQQEQQDLAEWRHLQDLRDYTFAIMTRTTDSYLQTVQATGAQFANLQAKRFCST